LIRLLGKGEPKVLKKKPEISRPSGAAGLVTKRTNQGLQYGSVLHVTEKKSKKREIGIFSCEAKLNGIQTFRDELILNPADIEHDQAIIRREINAGLSIPLIK
jgi:hypothetical protein